MGEDIKRKEAAIKRLEEDIDRLIKNIGSIRNHFNATLGASELAAESKNKTVKKYLENLNNSLETLESKISRSIDLQIDLLEDRLKNRCESVEEYSTVLGNMNSTIERYNDIRNNIIENYKKYNGLDYVWEDIKMDDRIDSVDSVYIKGERTTLNQYFADVETIKSLEDSIKESDIKRRQAEISHADDSQSYSDVFQEMRTAVLALSSSLAFSDRNYKINADKFMYNQIGEITIINRKFEHNKEYEPNREEREMLYNHYMLASRLFLSDLARIFNGPDLDVPTLNDMVGKVLNGEIDKNSKHETFTYIVEAQKYRPKDSDMKDEDVEILTLYDKISDMHSKIDKYLSNVEGHSERIDFEIDATEKFKKEIEEISNKHKEDPILRRIFERVGLSRAGKKELGIVPVIEKDPQPIPILPGAGVQPPRRKATKIISKKTKVGLIIAGVAAVAIAIASIFSNNNGQVAEQAAQAESAEFTKDNAGLDNTFVEIEVNKEIDLAILDQMYNSAEERKTVTDEELVDFVEELQEKRIFDEEKTKEFLELFEEGYEVTTPALNNFIQKMIEAGHLTAENAISYLTKVLPELDPINNEELQEFIDSLPKSKLIDKKVIAEFVNSFESRIVITTENFDTIVTSLRNAGVGESLITEFTTGLTEIQAFDKGKVMEFLEGIMKVDKVVVVTPTPKPQGPSNPVVDPVEPEPTPGPVNPEPTPGPVNPEPTPGPVNPDPTPAPQGPSNPPQGDYFDDNKIPDTPTDDTVPVTDNKDGAQGFVSQGNYDDGKGNITPGESVSFGTDGGPVTPNNPSQMQDLISMRDALTNAATQSQAQGQGHTR